MNTNIKTKQIKICTWNVCLKILHKIHLLKMFVVQNEIDILCIQEAEVKPDDNIELINIRGFSLEIEKASIQYSRRTLVYVKDSIKYQRKALCQKEDAHIICIILLDNNVGLASTYKTHKLTHKEDHKPAMGEQITDLDDFMASGMDTLIKGDINLDYRKRNDLSYHPKQIYEQLKKFEQEHQLLQVVDFTTWQRTNGGHVVQSILVTCTQTTIAYWNMWRRRIMSWMIIIL